MAATAKISTEGRETAEDFVAIDILMIQELVKTVKSFQSNMVELKSRAMRPTNCLHRLNHPGLPLYHRPVAKYVAKVPFIRE